MKTLYFESTTALKFDSPVYNHHFLLRILPPSFAGQRIVSATLELSPQVQCALSCDGFGNMDQVGCIKFPHTEFVYSVKGIAKISDDERQPERLHPIFKHPSTFTRTNHRMKEFLDNLNLTGTDLEKSMALCDAVFNHMIYTPGATSTQTTAIEAFELGKGVCQDYAHVFIALSRLAGIPARYANGLPLGEGASHAWTEVYVDKMWIGIDPTHNRLVAESYIRFCIGRDFQDSALERGVFFGKSNQTQTTFTQVVEKG
ncbi:MAG: transglutaminase family protein [Bacillota bacterium]